MGKSLIITEKPSVAQDIARALGGFKKNKEFFESDKYLLSWAVGHLFELAVPEEMKAQDKWALDKLPIMPREFDLAPVDKMGGRVRTLVKLIKDKSVTELINACDAGREGELIFRYIVQFAKSSKPVKRLWLSSMTADAIRQGFQELRADEQMQPLAAAARSRNEADWLVGINATRAFTLRLSGGRGSTVTSLGRVQTPTLAIMVEREEKIKRFKPRDVFEVVGHFKAQAGNYAGRWFDEAFRKEESESDRATRLLRRFSLNLRDAQQRLGEQFGSLWDEHRAAQKLWHREVAQAIEKKCAGKTGVVEVEEKKPTTQIAPQLYDLTTLQREANNRFGFPARRTLQIAQALYERHKLITYPRTDSRCLPEDYLPTVKNTLRKLGETPLGVFATKAIENDWVKPNKRIFNNARVSDHFAIIPTPSAAAHLHGDEQAIYEMIVKRFIAVFYPPAQFEVTTRITRVEGEPFKTEGKILKALGWMEVYGRELNQDGDQNLPPVTQGEHVHTERIEIKQEQTKPPPRYTEATILSAMEGAGKLLDDEELAEAMKERGLGTPATRAQIIDNLVAVHYLTRHGKELQPTSKAMQTIGLLKSIPVNELVSPELTGEWEFRLREIEHRKLTRDTFMRDIRTLTKEIVEKAKTFTPDEHVADAEPFGQCPKCGSKLVERFKGYSCTSPLCDFTIWKNIAGHLLTREEFETLLRERKIGPLKNLRGKSGKRFNAIVRLTDNFKTEFDFKATAAAATTDIVCEKCQRPMAIKVSRRGEFLACTGYPECRNALSFKRDETGKIIPIPRKALPPELENLKEVCDKCGSPMAIKMSRRGPFLACTAYPKCKNAKPVPDELKSKSPAPPPKAPAIVTDILCDKCGKPMVIRASARGKFLGCSGFPRCRNAQPLPAGEIPLKKTEASGESAPAQKPTPRGSRKTASAATSPDTTAQSVATAPPELTNEKCDKCGSPMVPRIGRFGLFIACSAYPKCKNIKKDKPPQSSTAAAPKPDGDSKPAPRKRAVQSSVKVNVETPATPVRETQPAKPATEPTGEMCDKCGSPMVQRTGRYGPFIACSAYPKCKNIKKNKAIN